MTGLFAIAAAMSGFGRFGAILTPDALRLRHLPIAAVPASAPHGSRSVVGKTRSNLLVNTSVRGQPARTACSELFPAF